MRSVAFVVVSAAGMAVQLGVIAVLTSTTTTDYRVATIAGVAAAVLHNFVWHRHWTWHDRDTAGRRVWPALCRFAGANGLVSSGGNVAVTTMLVGAWGWPVLAANVVAIAVCGIANYVLADRVVFVASTAVPMPRPSRFWRAGRPIRTAWPRHVSSSTGDRCRATDQPS